jgi:glycosyltransferase involved in cell wall biosynthesis
MNVADDQIFHPQERQPQNGDREVGGFHLIYHGTMTHRYGVDLLIHAIDRVRREIPGVHLTIHGRGETLDELRNLVDGLKLHEHITFSSSYVPISELPRIIQGADLGIVPYRRDIFTDGILPTKLLEYVALGVPVLAAQTPIIRHYFDDGMVEFFPPEDVAALGEGIITLYHNPARLVELARNASQFNQRYRWGKIASEYADVVDNLARRASAGGIAEQG